MKAQSEIDRLDLVARAEATKVEISRAQLPLTILSLSGLLLSITSEASFSETLLVRLMTGHAIVTTILVWLRSRFAVYALLILYFLVLAVLWLLLDDPDSHTVLGSTARAIVSALVLFAGYRWWITAKPFIAAQSKDLDNERSKVAEWSSALKSPHEAHQLVEFSTKSFVRGYWTYRLLNTGYCWAFAKFKTGKMDHILDFRVLGSDAVHVTESPPEQLNIELAHRLIQGIQISDEMRDRLLRSAGVLQSATDERG